MNKPSVGKFIAQAEMVGTFKYTLTALINGEKETITKEITFDFNDSAIEEQGRPTGYKLIQQVGKPIPEMKQINNGDVIELASHANESVEEQLNLSFGFENDVRALSDTRVVVVDDPNNIIGNKSSSEDNFSIMMFNSHGQAEMKLTSGIKGLSDINFTINVLDTSPYEPSETISFKDGLPSELKATSADHEFEEIELGLKGTGSQSTKELEYLIHDPDPRYEGRAEIVKRDGKHYLKINGGGYFKIRAQFKYKGKKEYVEHQMEVMWGDELFMLNQTGDLEVQGNEHQLLKEDQRYEVKSATQDYEDNFAKDFYLNKHFGRIIVTSEYGDAGIARFGVSETGTTFSFEFKPDKVGYGKSENVSTFRLTHDSGVSGTQSTKRAIYCRPPYNDNVTFEESNEKTALLGEEVYLSPRFVPRETEGLSTSIEYEILTPDLLDFAATTDHSSGWFIAKSEGIAEVKRTLFITNNKGVKVEKATSVYKVTINPREK